MRKQFLCFYSMKNDSDKVRSIVPMHFEYWEQYDIKEYMGGPFTDKQIGVITFEAKNLEEAKKIILDDPFVYEDLIEHKWIKEC